MTPIPCRFSAHLRAIGGETGRMMAEKHWSGSALGAPQTWPQSLRSVVGLMLASKFPMFVAWGPTLGFLYNDAYAQILGAKHPAALGAGFRDVWPEIWSDISPLIDASLGGEALFREDLPLVMNRQGFDEQTWFTFSYSPVHDESGQIAGMFCAVAETTAKVVAEKRQGFGLALGDALATLTDPAALAATAAELIGRNLEASRAGYAEIAFDQMPGADERALVACEWTDGIVTSRAGDTTMVEAFGPEVIARLRTGHTLVVEDSLSDPKTLREEGGLSGETRALIIAPLLSGGRLIAILHVGSRTPRAWSAAEVRLVEDVAVRTSAAVDRVRTEFALRTSEAALAAEVQAQEQLQEISTQLVSDESPAAIYDAILNAATDLMGSEAASIQILRADGSLELLAHRGYDPRSAAYWQTVSARSESTCGIALTTGERMIVHDVENSGLAPDSGDLQSYRWTGMRAVHTTPLRSRSGKPLGMLSNHWKRPHTPSPRDLKLFDVLARQAADAIERTVAQARLRESEARQAFLLSLSDALRPLNDPVEIASLAAERLGEWCGLSRVFYAEFFGSLMRVERDHARGVDSLVGEHDLAAFGPQLLRAYHEYPIVKVDDVDTDPRFGDEARAGLRARQVAAYLDVVLFEEEEWVSVLALQSATPRTWTESEEGLFREVGERVRTAIDRARSEDQLRELNETLERRVSEALAERNMLAKLVEMTDVMIMAIDLDFNILALNTANATEFERIFGIRPRSGENMLGLLADKPDQREAVRAGWARGMLGEPVTFVEDYGNPDRDRPCFEINFRPLRDENGQQIGIYQFAIDVTERLRREAELAEAQEALRQSQKMESLGQLTGGVAHDFNNLLTPIIGSLDLLQRKQVGNEREQRLIAGAMQCAERAKTLVQRLLAFARRQPLQPVPVDLARMVADMGDIIASTTGPQIKVVIDAGDGLPPAKADPNQLEMALLNLAVNARDAMAEQGGTLRISTRAEVVTDGHRSKLKPGPYLCLSVADTGAGMDEATVARAIEPFFSTKGVGKGTGLGLSMVHGLASQLGGALTIQSHIGLGTNIEFWLPESETTPAPVANTRTTAESGGTSGTVLLVDDEDLVRMITNDMLTDLGFRVVEARSAEEALRIARQGERFDILVTDHLMPGITGTSLAQKITTMKPGTPVLLVSGYAEMEGVDPSLPCLTKPFRKDDLATIMSEITAERR